MHGCVDVTVLALLSSMFGPFSCFLISNMIITAERSNCGASHFPVSTKLNLLSEKPACLMECRSGKVCWRCQQGQIERGCWNPELTNQMTCCTFAHPQILLLWLLKGHLHAALNLWGSEMVYKLPPQKPWELFLSICEWTLKVLL